MSVIVASRVAIKCPVCLDSFEHDHDFRPTACGHSVCSQCEPRMRLPRLGTGFYGSFGSLPEILPTRKGAPLLCPACREARASINNQDAASVTSHLTNVSSSSSVRPDLNEAFIASKSTMATPSIVNEAFEDSGCDARGVEECVHCSTRGVIMLACVSEQCDQINAAICPGCTGAFHAGHRYEEFGEKHMEIHRLADIAEGEALKGRELADVFSRQRTLVTVKLAKIVDLEGHLVDVSPDLSHLTTRADGIKNMRSVTEARAEFEAIRKEAQRFDFRADVKATLTALDSAVGQIGKVTRRVELCTGSRSDSAIRHITHKLCHVKIDDEVVDEDLDAPSFTFRCHHCAADSPTLYACTTDSCEHVNTAICPECIPRAHHMHVFEAFGDQHKEIHSLAFRAARVIEEAEGRFASLSQHWRRVASAIDDITLMERQLAKSTPHLDDLSERAYAVRKCRSVARASEALSSLKGAVAERDFEFDFSYAITSLEYAEEQMHRLVEKIAKQ